MGPTGLVDEPGAGTPQPMMGATPTSDSFGGSVDVNDSVEENNCGLQYFDVERRPADVLLVLDRSGERQEAQKEYNKTENCDFLWFNGKGLTYCFSSFYRHPVNVLSYLIH
jgi:hypothetical protein